MSTTLKFRIGDLIEATDKNVTLDTVGRIISVGEDTDETGTPFKTYTIFWKAKIGMTKHAAKTVDTFYKKLPNPKKGA